MSRTVYFFITTCLVSGFLFSCIEKIDKPIVNNSSKKTISDNSSFTSIENLDLKKDYFVELGRMLSLSKNNLDKIRKIILDHRKNRKGLEGNELDIEVNKREALLSEILTKSQMAQKSFIDFKYFGAKISNPFHPINIQITHQLSDAQMLKFIEICQQFSKNDLRKEKLNGIIDNTVLDKILTK